MCCSKHQAETRPGGPRTSMLRSTNWQVWMRASGPVHLRTPLYHSRAGPSFPQPRAHPSALCLPPIRGSWGVAPARASLDRGLGAHETCPVSSNSLDSPPKTQCGFISALRQQCFNMPLLSSSNLIPRAGTKSFLDPLRPFTFFPPISNSHLADLDHPCICMTIANSPTRA